MEVTLAVVDASNVLNALPQLILEAIELRPGHAEKLQSHCGEISKAQRVVELIRTQEGLRTSGVVAGIRMLESHGSILKNGLVSLGEDEGEYDLGMTVEMLRSERKRLVQQIRLASVGLAKADGVITVDTKVVKSTDEAAKKLLGKELGLDIPLFLAKLKRDPDEKGKIRLTDNEYEEWTSHQIKTCHPETKALSTETKTRIACNCLASGQSIQVLGPVGQDLWADIAFVKTEGLVSMDQAVQLGYAQSWDVFREALDRQDKRIASSHARRAGAKGA